MTQNSPRHDHDYLLQDPKIQTNEKKTLFVVVLTFIAMVVEITFGYMTGSMALLADGWHMGSHVGALGISVIAYKLARSNRLRNKFTFGTGKFVPLGGFTSSIMLGFVAFLMGVESLKRIMNPVEIHFSTAILVAVAGLVVNLLSTLILWDFQADHDNDHDGHEHESIHSKGHVHDHNHQSALVHVIADAFTSVLAIIALLLGSRFGWAWADPVMGIFGSVVILKWAFSLAKATSWELLDCESKAISSSRIRAMFSDMEGVEITDLHIWRVAPNAHACEMVVFTKKPKGSEFYRERILKEVCVQHLIIEETVWSSGGDSFKEKR